MPSNHADPELRRLREWCGENDLPVSTIYEKLKKHGLKVIKVGKATYLPRETRDFITSGKAA